MRFLCHLVRAGAATVEASVPEVAYKGSFNVRFKKRENHRRAAIYAMTHGQSLNSFIEETVEERLNAVHA